MKKIIPLLLTACLAVSCDDIFEQDISGKTISIVAPANNAEIPAGTVTFSWNELQGATSYRIIVVSPDFASAATVAVDQILRNDSITTYHNFQCELAAGSYQWGISASNSAYSTKRQDYSFTVTAPPDSEVPEGGEEEPDETP